MKFTKKENSDALQEETASEVMFCFWLLQVKCWSGDKMKEIIVFKYHDWFYKNNLYFSKVQWKLTLGKVKHKNKNSFECSFSCK